MKRISFRLILLLILLVACTAEETFSQTAVEDVLVVSDGTTEKTYTAEDLRSLSASDAVFNDVTYIGVPLVTLLHNAGMNPQGLRAVKAVAADGFSANYEPALFLKDDTLVAYARADGPLADDEQPFRMVLPGEAGKLNVRILTTLQAIP